VVSQPEQAGRSGRGRTSSKPPLQGEQERERERTRTDEGRKEQRERQGSCESCGKCFPLFKRGKHFPLIQEEFSVDRKIFSVDRVFSAIRTSEISENIFPEVIFRETNGA